MITGGNYYVINLEKNGGNFYLKAVKYEYDSAYGSNEPETELANFKLKNQFSEIYLKICMDYPGTITFYTSYDGNEYAQLCCTCNYKVSRKSWVGARAGIYCVNSKGINNGGYADFKYVKFE